MVSAPLLSRARVRLADATNRRLQLLLANREVALCRRDVTMRERGPRQVNVVAAGFVDAVRETFAQRVAAPAAVLRKTGLRARSLHEDIDHPPANAAARALSAFEERRVGIERTFASAAMFDVIANDAACRFTQGHSARAHRRTMDAASILEEAAGERDGGADVGSIPHIGDAQGGDLGGPEPGAKAEFDQTAVARILPATPNMGEDARFGVSLKGNSCSHTLDQRTPAEPRSGPPARALHLSTTNVGD